MMSILLEVIFMIGVCGLVKLILERFGSLMSIFLEVIFMIVVFSR